MKITNFNPDGIPVALGGWSTGIVSLNSNVDIVGGGPSAINFVQRITANTSNTLLNPIVNFASGSGIALSAASNTITITGTAAAGGGSAMDWFDIRDYGAVVDGSTDDTSAVQSAINACMTAGGGTVYFPPGICQIDGALVSTSTFNSQLTIPQNAYSSSNPPKAIRFLGMGPNIPQSDSNQGVTVPPAGGSIIRSSWDGSISGNPAIISAGLYGALPGDATSNFVFVTFQDISIMAHADPKLSAIQMEAAYGLRMSQVTIGTNANSNVKVLPTHSNAIGIDMPWGLGSQEPDSLYGVTVENFYTGLKPSEQANGEVSFGQCVQAILFVGGQGSPTYTRHANHFSKVLIYQCTHGLVFTTDIRWVNIGLLNIEHDGSPFTPVYDIDDASNLARGFIAWHTTQYSTGPDDNLLVNGGTGLSLFGALAKRWKLNNVVDVPIGTNPSANPANGRRLYADSSTGHLSSRDSSGTVYDYETGSALTIKDEGSSLATAATSIDFVGAGVTASGTGAAKTVTIPANTSELVIADGHSTPPVFADILFLDDNSDFLYSG